ncbi:MAG: fimbrillin family protein [Dysgonamonadaceae bacterium]|nr:fimbrillin family protein [Dysgonamonadaceae bacterium]
MTKCTGKLWMIATIAAMTFASCSNEEVIDTPATGEELALSFGTYVGNSTLRASATDLLALKASGAGFYVLAWETGATLWASYPVPATPNFMNDVNVSWSGSAWNYSPVKYWPGKDGSGNYGKVSFFGYAPKTSSVAVAASGGSDPEITFTTPDLAADQIDLLADVLTDLTYNTSPMNLGKVNFQFEHLLSKIGFNAKLAAQYTDATVTVTKLEITYAANKIKKDGIYEFLADSWTPTGLTMSGTDPVSGASDISVTLNNSSSPTASAIDNGNYLILLPQATAANDITAELSYTVTNGGTPKNYTIEVGLPAVTWLSGKQYTYTFNLTLNSVVFDPNITVDNWDTSPGTINVP